MPKFRNGLAKVGRVYHFKFVCAGREYHGSTRCESKSVAEAVLRKKRDEAAMLAAGILPESAAPTLAKVAAEWKRAQELRKGTGKPHTRNVMGNLTDHMTELAGMRVNEIRESHAHRMVDGYLAKPGNTAGGANSVLRSLRLLLGFAVKRGYISRRPFAIELLDVQEKPKPFLPAERLVEFFQVLRAQGAPLRAQRLCWLMVTLGLRESEARHARIEYTDLINFWHTPYDPEVGTKGKEARPIPIFPWAAVEIAEMVGDRTAGLLVPGRFPSRPVQRAYTLPYVSEAGKAMGIPRLTPHALRGTYATLLSLEGAQAKAIQECLRHKDARTTQLYLRPVMESIREAGQKLGEKIGLSETKGSILASPEKSKRQKKKNNGVT